MENLELLHIGCGGRYLEGFINSDISETTSSGRKAKLDLVMDVTNRWPYEDNSIDGIVSMHLLQQLEWRDILKLFKEAYRVLKDGGVMRAGVPSLHMGIEYLLGWENINLIDVESIETVANSVGFDYVYVMIATSKFSNMVELTKADNRVKETAFYEVVK